MVGVGKGENTVVKIAIVEDDDACAAQLSEYVERINGRGGMHLQARCFSSGMSFLADYHSDYDLIFMDIDMPGCNGMETAQRLRKIDEEVLLVFVTNMEQFAIKGYEVHAFDFIVKPVSFSDFVYRLKKAVDSIPNKIGETVTIAFDRNIKRLKLSDIYYLEVSGHNVAYHTTSGIYLEHQSLAKAQKQFEGKMFCKCNSNYLVNLAHVYGIQGDNVIVAGEALPISRAKKKEFLNSLTVFSRG